MNQKFMSLFLVFILAGAPATGAESNFRADHRRVFNIFEYKPKGTGRMTIRKVLPSRISLAGTAAQSLWRRPSAWFNRGILFKRVAPLALLGVGAGLTALAAGCGGGGGGEGGCSSRDYYNFECPIFDYRGSKGNNGDNGSSGWGSIFPNGGNGENGQNGENGKNVTITLTASNDLSLIFIKAVDSAGNSTERVVPASDTRQVFIRADGGRGGDGGGGGSAYTFSDGPANGGSGGNGGRGGDGGVVTVQYAYSFLINYIQVTIGGGKGGSGGYGGSGSNGGWSGSNGLGGPEGNLGWVNYQPI